MTMMMMMMNAQQKLNKKHMHEKQGRVVMATCLRPHQLAFYLLAGITRPSMLYTRHRCWQFNQPSLLISVILLDIIADAEPADWT